MLIIFKSVPQIFQSIFTHLHVQQMSFLRFPVSTQAKIVKLKAMTALKIVKLQVAQLWQKNRVSSIDNFKG